MKRRRALQRARLFTSLSAFLLAGSLAFNVAAVEGPATLGLVAGLATCGLLWIGGAR